MNPYKLISVASSLALALVPNRAVALTETVIPLTASANLRHDSFGYSYTNLYGTADLYANLNSINDDRAVLEFSISTIPTSSTINSATLTIYVWAGGGTMGTFGTFRLFGYTGDGAVSMDDYYAQQVLLNTFIEGVPPTCGFTGFNVTSFIQNQSNGGSPYSGFLFQALSQDVLLGFGSPGPNSFPLPTLDVKYTVVPEPDVPLLFLLAVVIACWPRRSAIVKIKA
jgi:hypothetical protein